MTEPNISFAGRLSLAFGLFFSVLGDRALASRARRLRDGEADAAAPVSAAAPVTPAQPAAAPAPADIAQASPDTALQLLALLQRDARLIDFVEEDISGYADADIGAAARLVHDGCRKALREHFTIRPVRDEAEGTRVTIPEGFDAAAIRLTGNVVGTPPFHGSIGHRGWRVDAVRLPKLNKGHDATIIAPAEVEL
ncbi:DUF2760 domain-containing protein [Burkholderia sp. TSV86]|uniref:DUF2760 domain-containing protein n=1 Tax=Burkholderia sp. TSV86 TaxID=1385594 RepID=UPI000754EE91|nr:DUF2760 domain-containing protein [Burkholderia sp. TSV86]KVE33998.1 hypothetical protein WS68_01405 [Burkholderia sp. TSV86]